MVSSPKGYSGRLQESERHLERGIKKRVPECCKQDCSSCRGERTGERAGEKSNVCVGVSDQRHSRLQESEKNVGAHTEGIGDQSLGR